ncbi:MAG: hypothetical protein GY854_11480 [Deltaproteobacteria bacterium]|nr:hypothetical protein [Deltaproteobacteria bacterium]
MSRLLGAFCTIYLLFSGCTSRSSEPVETTRPSSASEVPASELPMCMVEKIESCEVESESPTETVYRCPYCRKGTECADCKDHACEGCSDTTCRCRL